MSDLTSLQQRVKIFGTERKFDKYHQPKDVAIDIIEEAAELLEHFQWRNGEELDVYISAHREDIEDELMDVLHGVLLMANTMGIDIVDAFERKMKKNEIKYPAEVDFEKEHGHSRT